MSALFSTKSGSKRIFAAASVNLLPGAFDLWNAEELFSALARLMLKHLDVQVQYKHIHGAEVITLTICIDLLSSGG